MASRFSAIYSSDSVEWYTPRRYVEAARRALGGIELDPASCAKANETVRAQRYFTQSDDGLFQQWKARSVFCNPPFGTRDRMSNQGRWSAKMVTEYRRGRFECGILLVNAWTAMKWFRVLFDYPICFVAQRVAFESSENKSSPTHANVFIYFGRSPELFVREFSPIGSCVEKIRGQQ